MVCWCVVRQEFWTRKKADDLGYWLNDCKSLGDRGEVGGSHSRHIVQQKRGSGQGVCERQSLSRCWGAFCRSLWTLQVGSRAGRWPRAGGFLGHRVTEGHWERENLLRLLMSNVSVIQDSVHDGNSIRRSFLLSSSESRQISSSRWVIFFCTCMSWESSNGKEVAIGMEMAWPC